MDLQTNLAAKRKEFVTSSVAASTALSYSGGNKPYRDRAKERRAVYGLDPTGKSAVLDPTGIFDF